jgi:hypothetical protein
MRGREMIDDTPKAQFMASLEAHKGAKNRRLARTVKEILG